MCTFSEVRELRVNSGWKVVLSADTDALSVYAAITAKHVKQLTDGLQTFYDFVKRGIIEFLEHTCVAIMICKVCFVLVDQSVLLLRLVLCGL